MVHIPLPHFNIKPNGWNVGDLLKGKIPSLGIKWYAQAMDNPMILDAPTIFGMSNGQMLGAGEAGAEVVAGRDTLMKMINQASNNRADEILDALHRIIALLSDEDRLHDIIVKALNDGSFCCYVRWSRSRKDSEKICLIKLHILTQTMRH